MTSHICGIFGGKKTPVNVDFKKGLNLVEGFMHNKK